MRLRTVVGVGGILVLAFALATGGFKSGPEGDKGGGDDGVLVTFKVATTGQKPGQPKPKFHYQHTLVKPNQVDLGSDQGGISVGDDGTAERSMGRMPRGTYVMVWVAPPWGARDMFVECFLYFGGKQVAHDTSSPNSDLEDDRVAVCDRVVA